jgi:hypothetical protein
VIFDSKLINKANTNNKQYFSEEEKTLSRSFEEKPKNRQAANNLILKN